MRTITSYIRRPKITAPQTPEQRTLHLISVPFLGTWTVTDRALQRMAIEEEAGIIGKRFSRETLTAHLASLEAPQATNPQA
jgi:hypothetical protein